MPGSEPGWWYGTGRQVGGRRYFLRSALSSERSQSARLRDAKPYRSPLIPVICVGNFTAGGSGKTPLAIASRQLVADLNREPWFLSRGYGGTLRGPLRVEPSAHSAVKSETSRFCSHVTRPPSSRGTGGEAPMRLTQAPRRMASSSWTTDCRIRYLQRTFRLPLSTRIVASATAT